MTTKDDKSLEEYLDGSSPVSEHYQQLEAAQPPEAVDRDIIAAARAAVANGADNNVVQLNRWRRWTIPVALAATVVFAVPLVVRVLPHGSLSPDADHAPTVEAESVGNRPVARQRLAERQPEREVANAAAKELAQIAETEPPSQFSPQPSPPQVKASQAELAETLRSDAADTHSEAGFADAAVAAPAERAATYSAGSADRNEFDDRSDPDLEEVTLTGSRAIPPGSQISPDYWLDEIQTLYLDGRRRQARRELGEFLLMYPDYVLPKNFPVPARRAISPARKVDADADSWLREITLAYEEGERLSARRELSRFLERYPDYELPPWVPLSRSDAIE